MSFAVRLARAGEWHRWVQSQFDGRRKGVSCDGHADDGTCERCGFCCHLGPATAYALHDARGEFHAGGNYDDAVRAFKADLAVMLRTLCGAALAGYRP